MVAPAGALAAEEDAECDRRSERGGHDDTDPRQELERCLHDQRVDGLSDGTGAPSSSK